MLDSVTTRSTWEDLAPRIGLGSSCSRTDCRVLCYMRGTAVYILLPRSSELPNPLWCLHYVCKERGGDIYMYTVVSPHAATRLAGIMKHDESKAEQSTAGQTCALSFMHEEGMAVERVRECQTTTYPWASMALLMTVTVGQRSCTN